MRLIFYELRKQMSGRILWVLLALLIVLNVVFCLRETENEYYSEQLKIMKAAEKVVSQDPEKYELLYASMLVVNEAYEKALYEWIDESMMYIPGESEGDPPIEPEAPQFPCQYVEGTSDFYVLDTYFTNVLSHEEYETEITSLRETAKKTLNNYLSAGYDQNSYAFRYQVEFWIIYGETLDTVKLDNSLSYGWDSFWKYDGSGLFLFLAVILIGSRLFTIERDSGMEPVLRATKRGRWHLAFAKLGAAALLTLVASLVFHLSALACCAYRFGLSDPFAPIQQSLDMIYCPYPFSQLGGFVLTVLVSALAAFSLCLLTALLTLLFKKAMPAIAITAAITGAEFYLLEKGGEYLSNINLLTAASPLRLWQRWLPIHIDSEPISYLPFLFGVLGVIVLLSAVISLLRWVYCGMGVPRTRRRLLAKWAEKRIRSRPLPKIAPKFRSVNLFSYEFLKPSSLRMTYICLVLIVLQIGISVSTLDGKPTFYDEMKAQYMQEYEGMTLYEAEAAISERLERYAEATRDEKATEMAAKCISGEITYEEYSAYLDLLHEALTHKDVLEVYYQELTYLIDKQEATGIETYPVLSTGFLTWLDRPFDIPVLVLILVMFSGIFAREHESKFLPLLRSTKRGRGPVWFAKVKMTAFCSLMIALGAVCLDLALLFLRYPTDYLTAPLVCIMRYRNTVIGITGWQYIILVGLLRLLGTLVFGLLVAVFSELLGYEWAAAGCALLTIIPYGLTLLGVSADFVDITMLISGDRLWLASTASGGYTMLMLFVLTVPAIAVGLSILSHKKFCK